MVVIGHLRVASDWQKRGPNRTDDLRNRGLGEEGDVGLGVSVTGVAHAIAFERGHDGEVHVR